jgi:tetratricopeptide (TPR) repeat protein
MSARAWMVAAVGIAVVAGGFVALRRAAADASAGEAAGLAPATQRFWTDYGAARAARAEGRLDEAIGLYERALLVRPDHEDSLYYLGHCYLEQRRYAEALASYRRLVGVSPQGSSRAYMQIALVHASFDPAAPRDLAAAREYFDRALAVDPDSGALLGQGEVAVLEGRWADARETLLRADQDNPMSIGAPYLLGYVAFRAGRPSEAWVLFRTAVARGELKKPQVKWTEEGDVKADPALRWKALARQSVFGAHWLRLRSYLAEPGPTKADMSREYASLSRALEEAGRAAQPTR